MSGGGFYTPPMMITRALLVLVPLIAAATPSFAQTAATTSSPTIEIALGMTLPQYTTAEFPGLTGAVAFLIPITPTVGIGLVGEGDLSYVRVSQTAGVRLYARRNRGSAFVQMLAGHAEGADEGIIHGTGGRQLQPGVGVGYGGRRGSYQLEIDYRSVKGGTITNILKPGEVSSQSGVRIFIAATIPLRRR